MCLALSRKNIAGVTLRMARLSNSLGRDPFLPSEYLACSTTQIKVPSESRRTNIRSGPIEICGKHNEPWDLCSSQRDVSSGDFAFVPRVTEGPEKRKCRTELSSITLRSVVCSITNSASCSLQAGGVPIKVNTSQRRRRYENSISMQNAM